MELFRSQGYEATSMVQVAEAADVSPSTLFRYFPTKADLVLSDDFDPAILAAFAAQPSGLRPLDALRAALTAVLQELSPAERVRLRERLELMSSTPPLRAALLDSVDGPMRRLSLAVARRTGRPENDAGVRSLVGAVLGLGIATMDIAADDPERDIVSVIDDAFAHLAAGLSLANAPDDRTSPRPGRSSPPSGR